MCQFDHQNVIKLHGVVTETHDMVGLEYRSRGNLKKYVITYSISILLVEYKQIEYHATDNNNFAGAKLLYTHGKFLLVLLKF